MPAAEASPGDRASATGSLAVNRAETGKLLKAVKVPVPGFVPEITSTAGKVAGRKIPIRLDAISIPAGSISAGRIVSDSCIKLPLCRGSGAGFCDGQILPRCCQLGWCRNPFGRMPRI